MYQLFKNKPPYLAYFSEDYRASTSSIPDAVRNSGDALCFPSSSITKNKGVAFGSTAQVDYMQGTSSMSITFPPNSIPASFTIASCTSYVGTTPRERILQGRNTNWLHGHWEGDLIPGRGRIFYGGWLTNSNNTAPGGNDEWLNAVARNASFAGNATPNNVLMNGQQAGVANTGTGSDQLVINNSNAVSGENSNFAFSYVIIWDQLLTNAEIATVSSAMSDYLLLGVSLKNYLFEPTYASSYVRPYDMPPFFSTFNPLNPSNLGYTYYNKTDLLTYEEGRSRYLELNINRVITENAPIRDLNSGLTQILNSNLNVGGYIRQSNIPSWCCQKINMGTQNQTSTITYNTNICSPVNVGVNLGTGQITIQVSGIYALFFHSFTNDTTWDANNVNLVINGVGTNVRNYMYKPVSFYHSNGMDILYVNNFSAGNIITLVVNVGSVFGNYNAVFSGFWIGI